LYQANGVVDELIEIRELAYHRLDSALLKVHEFEQVRLMAMVAGYSIYCPQQLTYS
jgi:hypothetical protein